MPPVSPVVAHQGWSDFMVFEQLFVVPGDWAAPPRAIPVGLHQWGGVPADYRGYDWSKETECRDGKWYWKHWVGSEHLLEPGNVIAMTHRPDGRFERLTGTISLGGTDFPLKPREGPAFDFRPNRLYPAMFPVGTQDRPHRRAAPTPPTPPLK
jgi:hypothetical protein